MLGPLLPAECVSLFRPLEKEKRIALAVSGGPDSTALMVLVTNWCRSRELNPDILVLTVDHGLRRESADEAAQVAEWAARLGVKHQTLCWRGKKPNSNIQAHARAARYTMLVEACHSANAGVLVTAHHLEDQAETFLLRLARGSGVDGLGAMESVSFSHGIKLVRPFLEVPKVRLESSLVAINHPWLTDPSNENERFARIKIRNLQPALEALGMTTERLAATASRMRAARRVLEEAVDRLAQDAVRLYPAGFGVIDHESLARANHETALRLLARCLITIGGKTDPPRYNRIKALLAEMVGEEKCKRTFWGCRIVRRGDEIWIWREAGRSGLPRSNILRGQAILWDGRFNVSFEKVAGRSINEKLIVRALEEDGWRQMRSQGLTRIKGNRVPAALGRTFVSFWYGNQLVAVPHMGVSKEGYHCKAHFEDNALGQTRSDR